MVNKEILVTRLSRKSTQTNPMKVARTLALKEVLVTSHRHPERVNHVEIEYLGLFF